MRGHCDFGGLFGAVSGLPARLSAESADCGEPGHRGRRLGRDGGSRTQRNRRPRSRFGSLDGRELVARDVLLPGTVARTKSPRAVRLSQRSGTSMTCDRLISWRDPVSSLQRGAPGHSWLVWRVWRRTPTISALLARMTLMVAGSGSLRIKRLGVRIPPGARLGERAW